MYILISFYNPDNPTITGINPTIRFYSYRYYDIESAKHAAKKYNVIVGHVLGNNVPPNHKIILV